MYTYITIDSGGIRCCPVGETSSEIEAMDTVPRMVQKIWAYLYVVDWSETYFDNIRSLYRCGLNGEKKQQVQLSTTNGSDGRSLQW